MSYTQFAKVVIFDIYMYMIHCNDFNEGLDFVFGGIKK